MANPKTIELRDFSLKIKAFLLATQLASNEFPQMQSFNDLADFLGIKSARISEWVQGIPNKLRPPNLVPTQYVNRLTEALCQLKSPQLSLESAEHLWVNESFILFNAHLFNQGVSRIDNVLANTEQSLNLRIEAVKRKTRMVSFGRATKPIIDLTYPLNKDFFIAVQQPLNGWILVLVSNSKTKQLLLPNPSQQIILVRNQFFLFPKAPPYLQLNEVDAYTFTIIEIDNFAAPPIMPSASPTLTLNENEEKVIANILLESEFRWGSICVGAE